MMPPDQSNTLVIFDGNAMYHTLTEIPDTFRGISDTVSDVTEERLCMEVDRGAREVII